MSDDLKIGLLILLGVLITISFTIWANLYNNNQNVARDKYYADHCQVVKSSENNIDSHAKTFECAK
jgi:hypothetical protein